MKGGTVESSKSQETKPNEVRRINGCSNGEQQESDKVTRTQNNSEQDNGIKKYEKKILGIVRRETGPSETEVNVSQLREATILLMSWLW